MNKLTAITICAAALCLSSLPASAVQSSDKITSDASAADVWKKIGDFCGIANWHPAVEKCELSSDGKERTLSLKGGGTIIEDLVSWSDDQHSYTYKIKSGPLPVADYVSTIRVRPRGKGSLITWTGRYKAAGAPDAKAKETIDGIYAAGLKSLAQ